MNIKVKIPYTSVFSDKNSTNCILAVNDGKYVDIVFDKYNIEYLLKILFNYSNTSFSTLNIYNPKDLRIYLPEPGIFSLMSEEINRTALETKLLSSSDPTLIPESKLLGDLHSSMYNALDNTVDSKYLILSNFPMIRGMFSFASNINEASRSNIKGILNAYSNFIDYVKQESSGKVPLFTVYPDTFVCMSKDIIISLNQISVINSDLKQLDNIVKYLESIDIFKSEVYRKQFVKRAIYNLEHTCYNLTTVELEHNQINFSALKDKYNTRVNVEHLLILELANLYYQNIDSTDFYLLPCNKKYPFNLSPNRNIDLTKERTKLLNSVVNTPRYLPAPKVKILKIPKFNIVEQSLVFIEPFYMFDNSILGYNFANKLLSPILKTTYFNKLNLSKKQKDICTRLETLYTTNKVALEIRNHIHKTNLGNLGSLNIKSLQYLSGNLENSIRHLISTPMLENNFEVFERTYSYDNLSLKVNRDLQHSNRNSDVTTFSIIKLIADSIPSSINFLSYFKKESINFAIFANNYLRMLIVIREFLGASDFNRMVTERSYNGSSSIKNGIHNNFFNVVYLEGIILKKLYNTILPNIDFNNFQEYIVDPITGHSVHNSRYTTRDYLTSIPIKTCKSFSKLAISI